MNIYRITKAGMLAAMSLLLTTSLADARCATGCKSVASKSCDVKISPVPVKVCVQEPGKWVNVCRKEYVPGKMVCHTELRMPGYECIQEDCDDSGAYNDNGLQPMTAITPAATDDIDLAR